MGKVMKLLFNSKRRPDGNLSDKYLSGGKEMFRAGDMDTKKLFKSALNVLRHRKKK